MPEYQLYLGDCLDILRPMTDKGVEVIVTDPPYGIDENADKNASRIQLAKPRDYGDYDWDSERVAPIYVVEMLRVSRHQVIFGGNYYTDMLPASSSWVVWDKDNSGDFADCELAWTSHARAVRKFKWRWNGFIKQQPEERYHPTQKPLALMAWIIRNYTQPGDTVMDPFMGSGTTGVACLLAGRRFIGVEKNPHYYAIAERRIRLALDTPQQMELIA